MNVPIFIDLQGFVVREKFLIKEAAVLKNGKQLFHRIFKAAMPWNILTRSEQMTASWVMINHHGLHWNDGDIAYEFAEAAIRNNVLGNVFGNLTRDAVPRKVYTKGLEKKKWLEKIFGDAIPNFVIVESIDAEFSGIGSLATLDNTRAFCCERHPKNCAMENVMKLYEWWSKRQILKQEFASLDDEEEEQW